MHPNADLIPLVDRLHGVRVLCVGDVMLDRYVYGQVERISPEAPIPVLTIMREEAMLGGAGNVVRNLVGLGAAAEIVSVVGGDAAGREVTGLVGELDRVEPHLLVESRRQTTIKTRYIAGTQQMLRTDRETVAEVSAAIGDDVVRVACTAIADCAVMVLSDYAKGVLAPAADHAMIAAARAAGKPVIVDPKGGDFARYRGATLLTPNRRELGIAAQMPTGTDPEVAAASRRIIETCGVAAVLCTRGPAGMSLVTATGDVHHLAASAREVFDVSGAGDTAVATLAAGLGAGLSLLDAARLANVAAGVVVGKVGTATCYSVDLLRDLRREELASAEHKIMSREEALDAVARWRSQRLKIGFTNGCFDLLHPGHVGLMRQARAGCDRLVVGLNSDASVQRLKGSGRPVQNEAARAAVLASLGDVDLVVVFPEDTPLALIEALRPELLVKGADYTVDAVIGADLVQSWGGRVMLAEIVPGFSTTATIKRLAR